MDITEQTRTVIWQTLDGAVPGLSALDHLHLRGSRQGWSLEGVLLGTFAGEPLKLTYRVSLDRFWGTGLVAVTLWAGAAQHGLRIGLGPDGVWTDFTGQRDLSGLAGCTDIDLGFTPATNTIPIRRLNLASGQSAEVRAAWLRFPDLAVEPLEQRYTRLDETRYHYQSPGLPAGVEIAVDEAGLVVDYPGGWQRLAASS